MILQRTELRVLMCCHKCEEKVREEINEVYGKRNWRHTSYDALACSVTYTPRSAATILRHG